ncbi:MAG TPA: FtsX-like permease family protein [Streptosporangiaceae bacterium]|nr:FtsX-like permease family protein [Streptosporangiaceae bacterium]
MSRLARGLRNGWTALTGTGAAASVSLGLLVLVCVFVAVAGPRDSLSVRSRAFQRSLAATTALARSVVVTIDYTTYDAVFNGPFRAYGLGGARDELAWKLARSGLPLTRGADWSGLAASYMTVAGAGPRAVHGACGPPEMEVLYRDTLASNARLASGRLPTASPPGQGATLQVAVTPATAARFGLRPGSRLGMGGVVLLVTGIIQPRDAGSAFWTLDPDAAAPTQNACKGGGTSWLGGVFVSTAEFPAVQSLLNTFRMQLTWDFPLSVSHLTANQAAALQASLTKGLTLASQLYYSTGNQPTNVYTSCGLTSTLAAFVQEDSGVQSVLGLLFVSLAVMGGVAVLLGARLVATHRNSEFTVMRARGASLRQLALLALRGDAAVSLPAAAVGAAVAVVLTPGGGERLEWWLGGAVLLVALAGLPLAVVSTHRSRARKPPPPKVTARRAAVRRLIVEATGVGLTVGALAVLHAQGLGTTSGDLLSKAAPVLIAVPAAIVVIRCYPVLVCWLLRLARARRGVTVYVGLARSAGSLTGVVLPVFALTLGLAVVSFGAMVHAAVLRGQVAASWQQTGADAVVDATPSYEPLDLATQRKIAQVPGVRRSAAVAVLVGSPANSPALSVAVVDPAQFAALVADTPAPRFPAAALTVRHTGAPVPVLANDAAAAQVGGAITGLQVGLQDQLTIRVAGRVSGVPGVPPGAVLVVPAWAFGATPPPPTLMLAVGPSLDGRALESVVSRTLPGATVVLRSHVLAGLAAQPLPHGGSVALVAGAVTAAGLAMVVLLIALVLSARTRELTLARLTAMGLSHTQARWLVVAESLPLVVAAVVGGSASAWVLARLIGPSLNLSPLTGTGTGVPVRAEPVALAVAAAGLVVLALAAMAVQTLIASRRGAARALRME